MFTLFVGMAYLAVSLYLKRKGYLQHIVLKEKTKGFVFMLLSMLVGELVYFYFGSNWKISCMYLPAWIIPSLYSLLKCMKKGKIISENSDNIKRELKQLKVRTVIGSVVFSIMVFEESVYSEGEIHLLGLLWVIYGAFAFGFLLYFAMKFLLVNNEKK